jgi:TetR/AcrR family acrAB operon transcriptional repressor
MFATILRSGLPARPHHIMARRTKEAAAATRESLLAAAEAVFRDKGVAHTSLAEIAAAANVTRGAVYWHFRDKAELFKAMCERVQLPMEGKLASAGRSRHDDPLGALRAASLDALAQLATDPRTQAVFDVVFHKCEFAAEIAAVDERRLEADNACLANVERLLRQAVARGQLAHDTDTRLAAQAMNAFVVGIMHQWVQRPGAYDLARAAPQLIDAFLAGLRAKPPRRPGGRSGTMRSSGHQTARGA